MTHVRTLCAAVIIAGMMLVKPLSAGTAGNTLYGDHERGWFWYEVEPEPEEQVLPEIMPEPQSTATSPADPPMLSAEWIKKYLDVFKMKAIDEPTPENMAAYLYIQRVMLDKSQRFAEAMQNVVRRDPYLDQNTRRPIAAFGNILFAKESLAARKEMLAKIASQAGIFFMFQSSCKHCEIQAPVLKGLQERYGFVVFPVSIDGQPLGNGMYSDYAANKGQAQALGVKKTPALFLGRPSDNQIIPLGQSALSRDQLEQNILAAAREAGWITPEEFNRTQGMDTTLALDLQPKDMAMGGMTDEETVEYIKGLYQGLGVESE